MLAETPMLANIAPLATDSSVGDGLSSLIDGMPSVSSSWTPVGHTWVGTSVASEPAASLASQDTVAEQPNSVDLQQQQRELAERLRQMEAMLKAQRRAQALEKVRMDLRIANAEADTIKEGGAAPKLRPSKEFLQSCVLIQKMSRGKAAACRYKIDKRTAKKIQAAARRLLATIVERARLLRKRSATLMQAAVLSYKARRLDARGRLIARLQKTRRMLKAAEAELQTLKTALEQLARMSLPGLARPQVSQVLRHCIGPLLLWPSLAPADAEQTADAGRQRAKAEAAVGAAQLRSLVYEESEIRFVGGASHMCGGTVDVESEESARAAALLRAAPRATAYEEAEVRFRGGLHLTDFQGQRSLSHLEGDTVRDNALEEATRAAAVSRALGQAAAYEAADASADAGMIDWAAAEAREGGSEAAPLGEESGE